LLHYAAAVYLEEYPRVSQKELGHLLQMDVSYLVTILTDPKQVSYLIRKIASED
jgi:hypothetical protein